MKLYHRTTDPLPFRDVRQEIGRTGPLCGVWCSEFYMDACHPGKVNGAEDPGSVLWSFEVPERRALRYKIRGPLKPERIFVIPARLLADCRPRRVSERQQERLWAEFDWRWRCKRLRESEREEVEYWRTVRRANRAEARAV